MTDKELAAIRAAVHAEIGEARSFRRNGDSVPEWVFGKFLTLDRILMVIVLGFTIGGKTALMSKDTEQAIEQAAQATTVAQELGTKVDGLSAFVMEQAAQRSVENAENKDEIQQTRAKVNAIESRLDVTATRGELRNTVQQEILPRLQRIEQKVGAISP